MNLIEAVENKRIERGLTNRQLAEKLDIYTESWYRIKRTGQFGKDFVINAFAFLEEDTTTPETTQDGFLGRLIKKVREWV